MPLPPLLLGLFLLPGPRPLAACGAGWFDEHSRAAVLARSRLRVELGPYCLSLPLALEDDGELRLLPDSRSELLAWALLALGAEVERESFLGRDRYRLRPGLLPRVESGELPGAELAWVLRVVADRGEDGSLGAGELRRALRELPRWLEPRLAGAVPADGRPHPFPGVELDELERDWPDFRRRLQREEAERCIACEGLPHRDKLRVLLGHLASSAPCREGERVETFVEGANALTLRLRGDPGPAATLALEASDGRTYWDGPCPAEPAARLDGRLDAVSASQPFPYARYVPARGLYERVHPSSVVQWMYELYVDMAHSDLPREERLTVARRERAIREGAELPELRY